MTPPLPAPSPPTPPPNAAQAIATGVATCLVLASGLRVEMTERGIQESVCDLPVHHTPLPALPPAPGQSQRPHTVVVSHKMKAHGGTESLQGERLAWGGARVREYMSKYKLNPGMKPG